MTWVKQNYDRFLLALMALALAVCAGLLFNNARNFNVVFKSLSDQVPRYHDLPKDAVKGADPDAVERNQQQLAKPGLWQNRVVDRQRLPVFASIPYIAKTVAGKDGPPVVSLTNPYTDDPNGILHPPVPNLWLIDHNQNLLDSNVLEQDSDGDGFTTLDEYLGHTDPENKDSHPPYWTKLFLKQFVRIPFVLRFEARNGEKFLVNTVGDEDAPTQFVKLNDTVQFKDTKFKVTKFEEKHKMVDGINKDVSELTLVNTKNGQVIVLPKEADVDSPTTYAVFSYLWTGPGARPQFAVLRGGEFTLKPEDNVKYKVIEMSDTAIRVLKEDENKELSIRMRPKS